MKTIKATSKELGEKYISNKALANCTFGEFVRIEIDEDPSLIVIGQVFTTVIDGEDSNIVAYNYNVYDSSKDLYPVFYYAITKLMYHSIMYLRHLPIKSFNRFGEKERFEHEMNNINLLFSVLKNNYNSSKLLERFWVDSRNFSIIHLIELAKEYQTTNWEITETRNELFKGTSNNSFLKIEDG